MIEAYAVADVRAAEASAMAGLPDGEAYRVRSYMEAQPALRRGFDRMGRYLGLIGLLSLLVGGVGVAQVARAWLAARMDGIAVLRCLGATPNEVVAPVHDRMPTILPSAEAEAAWLRPDLSTEDAVAMCVPLDANRMEGAPANPKLNKVGKGIEGPELLVAP